MPPRTKCHNITYVVNRTTPILPPTKIWYISLSSQTGLHRYSPFLDKQNYFMMKLTSCVVSLLLGISYPQAIASIERVVTPGQSIAANIQDAHASGDFEPRFTLNAVRADSNKTDYMVRVREAVPAVTSMTTNHEHPERHEYSSCERSRRDDDAS